MSEIFQLTNRPDQKLFFRKNDPNDVRLGETVVSEIKDYEQSEVVILGCPQDEGVRRNGGRVGAAQAPDAIRLQFYKLTDFGIKKKVFDLGNVEIADTLEETHELHARIAARVLRDKKKLIVLGGGNDISYADGNAMAIVYGTENWAAINIDAHFDARADSPRNSGTPYRQLLEENLLKPKNFSEFAYQQQCNSPTYFDYLNNLGVNLISLEEIQDSTLKIQSLLEKQMITGNEEQAFFFGFDVDSVRAADAPGVSAPNTNGLSAKEFLEIARFAGRKNKTEIIEFTEVNPMFDIDNRTARLVATAMHNFLRQ